MWSVRTWRVSELHQECAKCSEGRERGRCHFVERSAVRQRYVKFLAATTLPFAREVWGSVGPDHRLFGRVKRICMVSICRVVLCATYRGASVMCSQDYFAWKKHERAMIQ